MKGIVLAGGSGSRLWPLTKTVSKQLLPVYNKPMIYYPIATLMLAGIKDILIITSVADRPIFEKLLGDGAKLGINFEYATQDTPGGIAQALIIGKEFLEENNCLLILGDNIFHGVGLGHSLRTGLPKSGAHIFTYEVVNPSDYGILEIDSGGKPVTVDEKPQIPKSRSAITGLYFFDAKVSSIAERVKPSSRGEVEITSVIDSYLKAGSLTYTQLSRGTVWLDTGNPNSLHDAASYVRVIEERSGQKIACLEEIAFENQWISRADLIQLANELGNGSYGEYLTNLARI
jgi:glucose-1-phosphate thymidylyltransferase